MAVICGQSVNSIRISILQGPLILYAVCRKLFGILRGESLCVIYVNNNIDSFGVLVCKIVYSFKTHLDTSSNLLVQCIVFCLLHYHSRSCHRWMNIFNF